MFDSEWNNVTSSVMGRRACNTTEFPSVNNSCVKPEFLFVTDYSLAVYGYVMPVLVLLTLLTNCLICAVLLTKPMRTPTNLLLVAMAVSDMLTGSSTMPAFIYFYTLAAYVDYMPFSWCLVYHWLTDYLPTIFHTTSVWLTVTLAAQRYIYVCHSTTAKRLCTVRNILKVIVGIYLTAFLSQFTRFIDATAEPIELTSYVNPNTTITGCYTDFAPVIAGHLHLYFNIYFWFRVVFIHFVPCSALVCLNTALSLAMRAANIRRQQLLKLNRRQECLRLQETNSTTLMLVVVVSLFLLVEFPLGVNMSIMIVENTGNRALVAEDTRAQLDVYLNLVILLSYPLNFFIYCAMSRHFRLSFRRLVLCSTLFSSSSRSGTERDGDGWRTTTGRRAGRSGHYVSLQSAINATLVQPDDVDTPPSIACHLTSPPLIVDDETQL